MVNWIRKLPLLAVLCAVGSSLLADTVKLKNGKILDNVKSKIEKDAVIVKYENGKSESLPKSSISSIKVAAIDWKKKEVPPIPSNLDAKAQEEARKLAELEAAKEAEEERLRVAEASAKGAEWTPRSDEEHISPWGNFALGLIPGYSGLYRTGNKWGGGAFTFLETIAVLGVADAYGAKRVAGNPLSDGYAGFGLIGLNPETRSTPIGTVLSNLILVQGFQLYGYEGGITGQPIAEIGQAANSEGSLVKEQSRRAAVLGFILIMDGIASYFSATAWNEGTFGGEKDPNFVRPTRPIDRVFRSAFLPGWGQAYGGNSVKGYTWMAGAVGLLANAGAKETAVTEAQRSYRQYSGFVSGLIGSQSGISADPITNSFLSSYLIGTPGFDNLSSAVAARNQAWSMYGAFWFLNLIDAYFFSGKNDTSRVSFVPSFQYVPVGLFAGRAQFESHFSLSMEVKYE